MAIHVSKSPPNTLVIFFSLVSSEKSLMNEMVNLVVKYLRHGANPSVMVRVGIKSMLLSLDFELGPYNLQDSSVTNDLDTLTLVKRYIPNSD